VRVHVIETGRVQIKASQIVGRGYGLARRIAPLFDAEWSDWLPVNAYAIEHRDGVILVDTGVSAAVKRLPRWHPYFRSCVRFAIEPEQEAGAQLRALGVAATDIKQVVLTTCTSTTMPVSAPSRRAKSSSALASLSAPPAPRGGFAAICRSAGPRRSIRSLSFSMTVPTDRFRNRNV
jgi:Metallo-beta-lactamase superfamily